MQQGEMGNKPAGGPPAGGPPAGGPPAGGPPAGGPPAGGPPMGAGFPPTGAPQDFGNQPPGNDPVTGVLNLAGFGKAFGEMSGAIMGAAQAGAPIPGDLALWYIDIRSFRSINPKYGFAMGNFVLTSLANCIREQLRAKHITRLGGDRFVLVSEGLDAQAANTAFRALVENLNDVIAAEGVKSRVSLNGGIYFLREADFQLRDFKRALDYASIAHRKAQLDPHSSLVLFTDEDLERDTRRIVIEQSIDRALEEGQIEVWYQPQVDYTLGEVVGAEALARWNHPDLGWISPAEFIPVLEECGKVHDLDMFVWEEACRSAGRWRMAADGKPVPISVNVSRTEMFEPGLMKHFKELQERYGLPNGCLHLEVTESAFVEEADRLYRVIESMRANDMVVEMDDFGSGLSSLNMLKDVPVDVVKLDMGFVRTGVNEERGGVVLGSIIRMLQGLDTPIIAEGVETLEQAEMLKNMGCRLMQGFHFSRPMPLDEFEKYVGTNSASDNARARERTDSHLEDLMSFDKGSSYLFNEAIGGTMFFFTRGTGSESILVNDRFYQDCGLDRAQFGDMKVNPIEEIDEESRASMWRAAAEARENGSAMCVAKVRLTGRWFEGCMRYLGESNRGQIFSLNICRSGDLADDDQTPSQKLLDAGWAIDLLDKIAPNGFVKARIDEGLTIDFVSPQLLEALDINSEELMRRAHNSFLELVSPSDRATLSDAVRTAVSGGKSVDVTVSLYRGYGRQVRATVVGRVSADVRAEDMLYLLVMLKGNAIDGEEDGTLSDRIVPFDYYMRDDLLVVHAALPDGSVNDIRITGWVSKLASLPDSIDAMSAAKVLATVNDLRHHPLSGFTDLKCNLRGGRSLRWYHINYTCDADGEGDTTVVHGYAQDANDEMGSTKWWRRQAEIDQLTGLLNRNAAEGEINLKVRTHGGGMMFMIDLDGFKRVNDTLGHLVGDDLLRDVSAELAEHFREGDVLGRYGGDEFVAFVPLSHHMEDAAVFAKRRADEIIAGVSRVQIPDGTHAACSVGVAVTHDRDASFYDLLEVADQALYASKMGGKATSTITSV